MYVGPRDVCMYLLTGIVHVSCFVAIFQSWVPVGISWHYCLMLQCYWSFWSIIRGALPLRLSTATWQNFLSFENRCWAGQGLVTTKFLRTLRSKWAAWMTAESCVWFALFSYNSCLFFCISIPSTEKMTNSNCSYSTKSPCITKHVETLLTTNRISLLQFLSLLLLLLLLLWLQSSHNGL